MPEGGSHLQAHIHAVAGVGRIPGKIDRIGPQVIFLHPIVVFETAAGEHHRPAGLYPDFFSLAARYDTADFPSLGDEVDGRGFPQHRYPPLLDGVG